MIRKKYMLNLRMFDGEGGTAGASASGTAPTGDTTASDAGKNKGETKVVYGIQDEPATEVNTQDASEEKETITTPKTPEARRAEYLKFTQGEYKDFYTEDTQNLINKRFKETKTLEAQLKELGPVIDLLGPKYGVTDGNVEKLAKAIQEDASYYEDEAMQKGLTVEQLKYQKQIERDNESLRKSQTDNDARAKAQETFNRWTEQSEAVKQIYPNFDFDAEINHPKTGKDFLSMIKHVDVQTAYQALHMDEIVGGAMQLTAQKTREATVNDIKSRSSRPTENGIASQTGVIVKNDVSKLTAADRQEIANRAARGEHITF